nr:unnamed protein product [Digitaria exilis]
MGAGLRDLESEKNGTDPPICPGDDADEDGYEEHGGAAERRRRSRHLPAARSCFAARCEAEAL